MRNLKRNAALVGASAIVAALGLGGVMSAQASNSPAPEHSQVTKDSSEEGPETNDGPNVGPDANPDEPGHQDANETAE